MSGSFWSCFQQWTVSSKFKNNCEVETCDGWYHWTQTFCLEGNDRLIPWCAKCPKSCRDYVRKKQWGSSSVVIIMFLWNLDICKTQNKWWNGKGSEAVALTKYGFFHMIFNTKVSILGQLQQFYSCCIYMVVLPHQNCHLWSFYTGPSASPTAASIFGAPVLWCFPYRL